ncbi:hypothetical protein QQF64_030345 [Cirrhinus molitorella]|uniref:Uncharacterized protein n=1 Tax=Cirrhinus molitorella TaxID=172907 RepID=A0ABR3N370_9TELE
MSSMGWQRRVSGFCQSLAQQDGCFATMLGILSVSFDQCNPLISGGDRESERRVSGCENACAGSGDDLVSGLVCFQQLASFYFQIIHKTP